MYENRLFISVLLQWKETDWFWTAVYCSVKQLSWVLHALQEDDNGEVVPASPMAAGEREKRTWHKGTETCPYFDANMWACYHSLISRSSSFKLADGLSCNLENKYSRDENCITHETVRINNNKLHLYLHSLSFRHHFPPKLWQKETQTPHTPHPQDVVSACHHSCWTAAVIPHKEKLYASFHGVWISIY